MSPGLHLILPGLFDLPLQELDPAFLRQRLPHLNRLLRLATPRENRSFTLDALLQQALGWGNPDSPRPGGVPLAQAFAEPGARDSDRMLLFEAVHLRPDLHSALLVPIQKDRQNLEDISIIINDLSDLFKVDCDITVVADGLYLMRLQDIAAPDHYPHLLSVLGKSVNPYIEQSRAVLPWYRLLNEMQMYLHQHEVNQDRIYRGLLPLNSLWFWGGGQLTSAVDSRRQWFCEDMPLNRFAQSLGLTPLPLDAIAENELEEDALVIDLRLLEALKSVGEGESLSDLLLAIDHDLMQPLMAASSRQRGSLSLCAGYHLDFILRPSAGLRFWRRRRSLLDWNATLDDG